jgi:hypothetical protein
LRFKQKYIDNSNLFLDEGHTKRGCWDKLNANDQAKCKNDEICSHSFISNRKVFLKNQLRCLQCENTEECKEPTNSTQGLPCKQNATECYESYENKKSE